MTEKMWVNKNDLTSFANFPKPIDIENWYEVDYDENINYIGKQYDPINNVFIDASPTESELKAIGVEIQGKMVSLNESNQNGFAAIDSMINKALKLGVNPFPIKPRLESKDGEVVLTINDSNEFDQAYLTFGLARQQFFN